MGWCSFVLLLMVPVLHANLSTTPLDDPVKEMNLNNSPNDPPSEERGRQMDKKRKRILGSKQYKKPSICQGLLVCCPKKWIIPDFHRWTASLKTTVVKTTVDGPVEEDRICGGVLISIQHILTALHCLLDENDVIVDYNAVEIYFDPDSHKKWEGTMFKPIAFYHTRWEEGNVVLLPDHVTVKDDIVLIKMDNRISAPLLWIPRSPNSGFLTPGFWFAGWGEYTPNGETPDVLRYTNNLVPMVCPNDNSFYIKHICFKSTNTDAICDGDSGSPGVIAINEVWHLQSLVIGGRSTSSAHIDVFEYKNLIDHWLTL